MDDVVDGVQRAQVALGEWSHAFGLVSCYLAQTQVEVVEKLDLERDEIELLGRMIQVGASI